MRMRACVYALEGWMLERGVYVMYVFMYAQVCVRDSECDVDGKEMYACVCI